MEHLLLFAFSDVEKVRRLEEEAVNMARVLDEQEKRLPPWLVIWKSRRRNLPIGIIMIRLWLIVLA